MAEKHTATSVRERRYTINDAQREMFNKILRRIMFSRLHNASDTSLKKPEKPFRTARKSAAVVNRQVQRELSQRNNVRQANKKQECPCHVK